MRIRALLLTLLLAAAPVVAQTQSPASDQGGGFFSGLSGLFGGSSNGQDQGGLLENFIQSKLSSDGRQVTIRGFSGALTGKAQLESLTIADSDGVWLTLKNVVLDWSRAALFTGKLDVTELTAKEILLPRLPKPAPAAPTPPTPEASGFKFSLPELPVSVNIGKIAADKVEIGAPVMGTAVTASITGSMKLAGGEGAATLDLTRLDAEGKIALDTAYSNKTQNLALTLDVKEGANGIIASKLGIPGAPSVDLAVKGDAPIDAFTADISLATAGQDRLKGQVKTASGSEPGSLRVTADLAGDMAPLFKPDYADFFGPNASLNLDLTSIPGGALDLTSFRLAAQSLNLDGSAKLGQGGVPEAIHVTGKVASPNGDPVLLPLSGPPTKVGSVDLAIDFDAAKSADWTGDFAIRSLDRPGFSAKSLNLTGTGQINTAAPTAVTAALKFDANTLDLGNADAAKALGETVTGGANIDWTSGGPLRLTNLAINGQTYGLDGNADFTFASEGPSIKGKAAVHADDISVFSGLAGRTLGGAAKLSTTFSTQPLAGFFDVSAQGTTDNLVVSQPQADGILAGAVNLKLSAARDTSGIRFAIDRLDSPNASITGNGVLKSGGSNVALDARLADASLVDPSLRGPITLTAKATQDANLVWTWTTEAGLTGTTLTAEGTARNVYTLPAITASGRLTAKDLSEFSALAKRPLAGSIDTTFSADLVSDLSTARIVLNGSGQNLATGMAQADALLAGKVSFAINAAKAADTYTLSPSTIEGDQISFSGSASYGGQNGKAALKATLKDASKVLPGAPAQPLDLILDATQQKQDWVVDASANGAGLTATVKGTALAPMTQPAFDGTVALAAADLSPFSTLAGRQLKGSIRLDAKGKVTADLSTFDVAATASGKGLSIGQPQADLILAGDLSANVTASRAGGDIRIPALALKTGMLDVSAKGALGQAGSAIDLNARLADLGPFVQGFSGPATAKGTVSQKADGSFGVDLSATGPGGTNATITGTAAADLATVNLAVKGSAPLGLANAFIAPRSVEGTVGFDLTVNGPPALKSVAGRISSSGARLAAPTLGVSLDNIALNATLANETAQLSVTSSVRGGGQIAIDGPLSLAPPFNSGLKVTLRGARFSDPKLYDTTVDGTISLAGALTGGAKISGALRLGETNVRIPSSGIGGAGEIPTIEYINERPKARATRDRAGLIAPPASGQQPAAKPVAFPLDITITAPNRIFVRGRGLDSEFGGRLRIGGTSANVVPQGSFNLIRGRLDILGKRLTLDTATITIQGSFVPYLNIQATNQADGYTITVSVTGNASDPQIAFTSQPQLPQEEVIARLLFGQGLDKLSAFQAAQLAIAVRTLAGKGGEGIVGKIRQGAGLANFDITTDAAGNAQVTAGAYINDKLYTDVTVGATGNTEFSLNFDVTKSVKLKGTVDNSGNSGLGVFYERDY